MPNDYENQNNVNNEEDQTRSSAIDNYIAERGPYTDSDGRFCMGRGEPPWAFLEY